MASKSEDIRLLVNDVRHKKADGALYLMAERVAWMPNGSDQFGISHEYSKIKTQKISSEGKPKIQLQIVLNSGETTTFQFINSAGTEAQLEDRRSVKDALLQLLPQFKGKIPKEREIRAKLLEENPHLLQLFKDLVSTKIITQAEFWSQFVGDQLDSSITNPGSQSIGLSPAGLFADLKPQSVSDGSAIKYNLSPEIIEAIFKTYPNVAKKYTDVVPIKMKETEFWTKFFQSHYFHRDRVGAGTKDLFTECAKLDEKDWEKKLKEGVKDPYLDVNVFDDFAYSNGGYGNSSALDEVPAAVKNQQSIVETTNQALIKRFNQHSIKVLASNLEKSRETFEVSSQSTNPDESDNKKDDPKSLRANRRRWNYDDLEADSREDRILAQTKSSTLDTSSKDKYSIAPMTKTDESTVLARSDLNRHVNCINDWQPRGTHSITTDDAFGAYRELSSSCGASAHMNRLTDMIPENWQQSLREIYYASNELLRHFWLCFPVVDKQLEVKLLRVYEQLQKFESTKLKSFHDELARDQHHLGNSNDLIKHLMSQYQIAYRRFDEWKEKKRRNPSLLRTRPQ